MNESLAAYRFDEAANAIYDFFWGELCDWYLELIKPRLAPESDRLRRTCANLMCIVRGFVTTAASRHAVHHRRNLACDVRWKAAAEISGAGGTYPQADESRLIGRLRPRWRFCRI